MIIKLYSGGKLIKTFKDKNINNSDTDSEGNIEIYLKNGKHIEWHGDFYIEEGEE